MLESMKKLDYISIAHTYEVKRNIANSIKNCKDFFNNVNFSRKKETSNLNPTIIWHSARSFIFPNKNKHRRSSLESCSHLSGPHSNFT